MSAFYQYDRSELLQLRPCSSQPLQPLDTLKFGVFPWISDPDYNSASQPHSTRKRSKRGGLLVKLRRRKGRPAVPSLVLANVQRLYNKTDELHARIQTQRDFRDCSVFIFSGTWLNSSHPDSALEPPGFTIYRTDRSAEVTGKTCGGGVCFLVNKAWCTDVKVISSTCSPDLETLTIKCRPYYLPRDFGSVVLTAVYIHPRADIDSAISTLSDLVTGFENSHTDCLSIVAGDFNRAFLKSHLPKCKRQLTCPTRGSNILDHCYCPFKNAYKSSTLQFRPRIGVLSTVIQTKTEAMQAC